MRLGDLGAATGVDIETIRYYEKQGLLQEPARQANGYRSYAPKHLERLSFIRHCRALEMPLADVRQLLELVDSPARDCSGADQLVDEHIAKVRARLKSMRALEKQLVALRSHCQANKQASSCGILKELVAAALGEACACHRT